MSELGRDNVSAEVRYDVQKAQAHLYPGWCRLAVLMRVAVPLYVHAWFAMICLQFFCAALDFAAEGMMLYDRLSLRL